VLYCRYTAHFATYLKAGVESDDLEDLYTKVGELIGGRGGGLGFK
jgi:hypothetical protein